MGLLHSTHRDCTRFLGRMGEVLFLCLTAHEGHLLPSLDTFFPHPSMHRKSCGMSPLDPMWNGMESENSSE